MNDSIVLNLNSKEKKISKHIYGHFSEHLGRCIYDGFWVGKDSKIPNIDGYRLDVIEAFKKIKIPNLRWPGGCFADEYHWKDGIGPQIQRKKMINTHWGGVTEDNSFGTHEFMHLCELLECDPYICGNVGSGSVREMSEWIEYITFSGVSPMADLRKENGHPEAWKLPFFGVGNENWGGGGNMRPEYYADLYRNYQTYVRQYGNDKIYKIACGANSDDYNWTKVLMERAGNYMDGLSLHYYTLETNWEGKHLATDFDETKWYSTLRNAFRIEEIIEKNSTIMDQYDPAKKVGLIVDEWGCWHAVEEGTNPGFLYQQNTMRDALVAGLSLNIFNNHCERVKMSNIAQAVNVLQSPILTKDDQIVLTPTWYVFDMYKKHQDAQLIEAIYSNTETTLNDISIPALSVSASLTKTSNNENAYLVTVCNTDLSNTKTIEISLSDSVVNLKKATGKILNGEKMNSCNTFEKPDEIQTKDLSVFLKQNKAVIDLPPASIATVEIIA